MQGSKQAKTNPEGVGAWIQSHPWLSILIVLLAALILLIVYWAIWADLSPQWTGFGAYDADTNGPRAKTLWEWMDLLIVPIVLALGAFWLNTSQKKTELLIASQRQQQAALQAYYDRMATLLLDNESSVDEWGSVPRSIARARTLATLQNLDSKRKGEIILFLHQAELIKYEHYAVDLSRADLSKVDLREAFLLGADLCGDEGYVDFSKAEFTKANLRGVNFARANLQHANLQEAWLNRSRMSEVNLKGANLRGASLIEANISPMKEPSDLTGADLREANLRLCDLWWASLHKANLSRADLFGARLREANLSEADLSLANLEAADLQDADLSYANIEGATGLTEEQLLQVKTLEGATMPDGRKYEAWSPPTRSNGEENQA